MTRLDASAASRFNRHWVAVPESGCWLWAGAVGNHGYGEFWNTAASNKNRRTSAHRAAWCIFKGEIPEGMFVCHRCDVQICVNPAHLFLGTAKANSEDMVAKNRSCRGERQGRSVLKEAQIDAIRRDGRGYKATAKAFGVSVRAIRAIRSGETWRHI